MTRGTAGDVRDCFAALPTAVSVITTRGPEGPAGCTAGTVAPLSFSPSTLLVSLRETSATLTAIRESGAFAVNVLSWYDRDLATRFSVIPAHERFAGLEHREVDGVPVLPRSSLLLLCSLRDCLSAVGHRIVIGTVLTADKSPLPPSVQYEHVYRELVCSGPLPSARYREGGRY
ncbi:flavin reductase family protein [Nocardiopsis alba]|uniref:flavin reductase family protein n=1 Tax=Nocardiopsis alba TaxID=53437 RepID=UPI003672E309